MKIEKILSAGRVSGAGINTADVQHFLEAF